MPSTTTTRDWFLWSLSIVYLLAFVSFFVQAPGLVGRKGILPAYLVLQKEAQSVHEFVLNRPTILRLLPKIGLDLDLGLDFLCIGGMVSSFASFISRDHRNALVLFLQWFFYLSLVQVGQIFLASKWDSLLLEVGFVGVLLAPLGMFGLNDIKSAVVVSQDQQSKSPLKFKFLKMTENYRLPLWYVKWTLARVVMADSQTGLRNMFGGVVDGGGDWGGLMYSTDSNPFKYVLTSAGKQMLPTPFSWFVGSLPSAFMAIITCIHLITHIPVVMCVLSPWKLTRLTAFYWLIVTSVTTSLLGNQGFEGVLTITMVISLVDDDWFSSARHLFTGKEELPILPSSPQSPTPFSNGGFHLSTPTTTTTTTPTTTTEKLTQVFKIVGVIVVVYVVALLYEVPHLYEVTQVLTTLFIQVLLATLKVLYISSEVTTAATGLIAAGFLILEVVGAFKRQKMTMGCAYLKRIIIHMRFGLLFTTTITLFILSLVPLVWPTADTLSTTTTPTTTTPHFLQSSYLWTHKHYRLVNNYASLHRHGGLMGEGGRDEIVIEGSDDKMDWKEYHFIFKPSLTSNIPQIVAGHHPRLDESLWLAARSNYKQHHWLLNLLYRLLTHQKQVVELFESVPFETAPTYIRADIYHYNFNYDLNGTSDWWRREWAGHYVPVLSLDDPSFVRYFTKSGLSEYDEEEEEEEETSSSCHANNLLASLLAFVRSCLGQTSGSLTCGCLVVLGLFLSMVDPSRTTKYHVTMAPDHVLSNGVGGKKSNGVGGMRSNGVGGMRSNGVGGMRSNGVGGKMGREKNKGSVINIPIEILK